MNTTPTHSLRHSPTQRRGLPVSLRLLKEVLNSLGWGYGLFVVATIALGLSTLLPAELFRYFTENLQTLSSINAQTFLTKLSIFGSGVALAMLISSFGNTYLQEWLRLKVEVILRRKVLASLHRAPLTALDSAQRGDWISRMTGDLGQTEFFITESLPNQLRQLVILLGAGLLFAIHSGWVAAIPLATALLLSLINIKVQRTLAPVLKELRFLHGGVFQSLIESLEGIRTIRSHSVEPYFQRRFDLKLNEISTKSFKVVRSLGLLLGSNDLAAQAMVTATLTVVTFAVVRNQLTVSEALFYPFYIGLFYGAVHTLASSSYDWNRFTVEGTRIAQLVYQPQEPLPTSAQSVGELIPLRTETIRLTQIVVGHADGKSVGPINLEVSRGELHAVVGTSGCGKTTLLEVIAGLRPALSGSAEILDGNRRALWQSRDPLVQLPIGSCAYVEQHPYIFEGSLRENLSFGNSQRLSDTLIWNGIERTSLYEFAQNVGGLDYFLTDRGRNLSEGERYRIALCRALLLRRPFLLLDEPFAALDETTIQVIVHMLEIEKAKTGIVLVTHWLPPGLFFDGITNFRNLDTTPTTLVSKTTVRSSDPAEGISWSPILDQEDLAKTEQSKTTTN